MFRAGDTFTLTLTACNNDPVNSIQVPVFLILDVYGSYYCAPAWTESTVECGYFEWEIPPCSCIEEVILNFTWPAEVGSASNIIFYAALVNDTFTEIIGALSVCQFGWSE